MRDTSSDNMTDIGIFELCIKAKCHETGSSAIRMRLRQADEAQPVWKHLVRSTGASD